jgi:hypothetical protein
MTTSHLKTLIEAIAETLGISYILQRMEYVQHNISRPHTGVSYNKKGMRRNVGPEKNSKCEEFWVLGYNAMYSGEGQTTYCLTLQGLLPASCWFLAWLTLKMEAMCSSETSVEPLRILQLYMLEDGNFQNHAVRTTDLNTLLHSEEAQHCLRKWRHITSRCLKYSDEHFVWNYDMDFNFSIYMYTCCNGM